VILGGVLAGTIVNVSEWALHDMVLREQFRSALGSLGRQNPEDLATVIWWNFWGYILGIAAIWLYAAIRPRYSPGWLTALRAGFAVWLMVHATFSLATGSMQLLPQRLMILAALFSLPATLLSTLAGAWLYRE
jgi:hypothetical protein